MVIKQARKRDLLTQLLQDGGAGKFKAIAEAHGLTCVLCGQYEWNTMPGGNLVEYALSKGWNEIRIGRSSLPPFFHSGAAGTAQGGAGTSEKVSPAALAGTGKPTASAWDKSVTFSSYQRPPVLLLLLRRDPWGAAAPVGPSARGKNAVRGMYIPTQHISLQHSR